MNLTKLFEMQRELDERIVKEKELEGKDLLPQKILALQVELGECANEWRGFKFWSKDQQPRTLKVYSDRDAYLETNPLLEEYIDCLHFIFSIGIELSHKEDLSNADMNEALNYALTYFDDRDIVDLFNSTFDKIGDLSQFTNRGNYIRSFEKIIRLSKALGFTWEQIEAAYMDKNKTNHERQSTGY
ncbi:dUTP diphosphatase [Paenibacillus sp. Dod16]|uniref:dUTP diphosphatase n=1 Tax=Paenibacillus sp. Dod16 TaxID=3416392 RepID=UPI003CF1C8D8